MTDSRSVIRALREMAARGPTQWCVEVAANKLEAVGKLLAKNGCDCECDHDSESHDEDCERCLACRIDEVLG